MERATDETRWTRESQRDGHERSPQVGPIRQHEGVEQMKQMKKTRSIFAAICVALSAFALTADAQTAPPAPVLLQPGAGAALVQPITLAWGAVVDPDGPIGSYTWQVSPTSTFAFIIAAGFTNTPADGSPARTQATVSGLPNGTYFWRVKASQIVGGAVFALDSAWSVGSFTVVGLGPAPGTPSLTSPASPARFPVREPFLLDWTAVPGAQHYLV